MKVTEHLDKSAEKTVENIKFYIEKLYFGEDKTMENISIFISQRNDSGSP